MRLDPDLLRDILTRLADAPPNARLQAPAIDGRSKDEILEHLELLADAGFIEAKFHGSANYRGRVWTVSINRVTYAGQAFLATARNDTFWAETKKTFRDRGLDFTLDRASRFLTSLAARAMGLPPA